MRRQEGPIGLDKQSAARHSFNQRSQIRGLFEGDRAGKAKIEAKRQGAFSDGRRSRKRMQHARPPAQTSRQRRQPSCQRRHDIFASLAAVDDDRQFKLASQIKLLLKDSALNTLWPFVPIIIQPDLTDGDDPLMRRPFPQPRAVKIVSAVGMNANGGIDARPRFSQLNDRPTAFQVSRRDDHALHAAGLRPGHHRIKIGSIVMKVEMTVRVNQRQRRHQTAKSGLSRSRLRSLSTIIAMSSSKLTSGRQPSFCLALDASPISKSTSAGRIKRSSCVV